MRTTIELDSLARVLVAIGLVGAFASIIMSWVLASAARLRSSDREPGKFFTPGRWPFRVVGPAGDDERNPRMAALARYALLGVIVSFILILSALLLNNLTRAVQHGCTPQEEAANVCVKGKRI